MQIKHSWLFTQTAPLAQILSGDESTHADLCYICYNKKINNTIKLQMFESSGYCKTLREIECVKEGLRRARKMTFQCLCIIC